MRRDECHRYRRQSGTGPVKRYHRHSDRRVNGHLSSVLHQLWPVHSAREQILVVTQGTGSYQEQDKPIQFIQPGDSVNIAPNVVHWHGAGPEGKLTHIAINPNVSKGGAVDWLKAVTDGEYNQK